jgi:hypothetical protein
VRWVDASGAEVKPVVVAAVAPPPTPEQIAAREAQLAREREECLARERKRRKAKAVARRKGLRLLRLVLTAEEWREWRLSRSVSIRGSMGGLYRVWQPRDNNKLHQSTLVCSLNKDGVPFQKYCYHPSRDYCLEDQVAALVLDLKCDEARILKHGNVNGWSGDEAVRVARLPFEVVLGGKVAETRMPNVVEPKAAEAVA